MSQSREKNHSGNQGASQVTSSHITIKNDQKDLSHTVYKLSLVCRLLGVNQEVWVFAKTFHIVAVLPPRLCINYQ